jgi:hypothetical protein
MDYLTNFIVWSLATFGAANIVVYSTIFKPIRLALGKMPFFGKLVNCILCMGFWVGLMWGLLIWSPAEYFILKQQVPYQIFFDMLFNGSLGSCISWLIYLSIAQKMVGK